MKRRFFTLLLVLVLILPLMGCTAKQTAAVNTLAGTWKDNYGLTEYKFDNNGNMRIQALNLGSFKGTYQVAGDKITIQYRVLVKDVKDTYTMKLSGNTLYLDKNQFTRKK